MAGEWPGLTRKLFFHHDGALISVKLIADFLVTQRSVEPLCSYRRRHPQNADANLGSSRVNHRHKLPTDASTLVGRIDENASDYSAVEACSAGDIAP